MSASNDRWRPVERRPGLELPSRPARVVLVSFATVTFAALGLLIGGALGPKEVLDLPRPHTIPLVSGGTSLRIAMIHDVLHERYVVHGPAWYRERERRAREAIAREDEAAPTDRLLDLYDDLSAALDRQHRSGEAVEVQRRKLALVERLHGPRPTGPELPPARERGDASRSDAQRYYLEADEQPRAKARFEAMATRTLSPAERAWYRTCANLGTMLIHASFQDAWRGDAAARARFEEGLRWVRHSIELNPLAHFGREVWQAEAVGFFLAALDDASLLTRYDLIGQPLDARSEEVELEELAGSKLRFRGPWRAYQGHRETLEAWAGGTLDEAGRRAAMSIVWDFRSHALRRVGVAPGWAAATRSELEGPAPYDEPVLGILGMWMLGGGPNPHFALALGGVCERINQRHVAWTAYARAIEMAERLWPEASVHERLVAHCRARQTALEELLGEPHDALQARHEAELAFGRRFQEERQRFEAEQLQAGADMDAPDFFAGFDRAFEAQHGPIASPLGDADRAQVRGRKPRGVDLASMSLAAGGLGALLALAVRSRRRG